MRLRVAALNGFLFPLGTVEAADVACSGDDSDHRYCSAEMSEFVHSGQLLFWQ
jgi:hypothetical protein